MGSQKDLRHPRVGGDGDCFSDKVGCESTSSQEMKYMKFQLRTDAKICPSCGRCRCSRWSDAGTPCPLHLLCLFQISCGWRCVLEFWVLTRALKIYVRTSCLQVSEARDPIGGPDATLSLPQEVHLPEHKYWMCFLLVSPPPVDKKDRSLLVKATFPLRQGQRCKAQPCKATPPLSGGRAIFYIYQLSKETAGLAVCWQRQSTPFLYSTSPWMFTGTKHERRSPVICLQTDFL